MQDRASDNTPVRVGDAVKIGRRFDPGVDSVQGEWFWTVVTEVIGDRITGRVENNLLYTDRHGLQRGSSVTIQRRDVVAIDRPH